MVAALKIWNISRCEFDILEQQYTVHFLYLATIDPVFSYF